MNCPRRNCSTRTGTSGFRVPCRSLLRQEIGPPAHHADWEFASRRHPNNPIRSEAGTISRRNQGVVGSYVHVSRIDPFLLAIGGAGGCVVAFSDR